MVTPWLGFVVLNGRLPVRHSRGCTPALWRRGWKLGLQEGLLRVPFPGPSQENRSEQAHAPLEVWGAGAIRARSLSCSTGCPPLPRGLRRGEGERSPQRTLVLSQLAPSASPPPTPPQPQPPPMSQASLPFAAGSAGTHWERPSLLKGT